MSSSSSNESRWLLKVVGDQFLHCFIILELLFQSCYSRAVAIWICSDVVINVVEGSRVGWQWLAIQLGSEWSFIADWCFIAVFKVQALACDTAWFGMLCSEVDVRLSLSTCASFFLCGSLRGVWCVIVAPHNAIWSCANFMRMFLCWCARDVREVRVLVSFILRSLFSLLLLSEPIQLMSKLKNPIQSNGVEVEKSNPISSNAIQTKGVKVEEFEDGIAKWRIWKAKWQTFKLVWIATFFLFDGFVMGSDVATCGAFAAVLLKMRTTKSAAGLSLQSIVAILTLRMLLSCTLLRELLHCSGISYAPPTHHTISLVTHASMKQCQQWHYSHSCGCSSMTSDWHLLWWWLLWTDCAHCFSGLSYHSWAVPTNRSMSYERLWDWGLCWDWGPCLMCAYVPGDVRLMCAVSCACLCFAQVCSCLAGVCLNKLHFGFSLPTGAISQWILLSCLQILRWFWPSKHRKNTQQAPNKHPASTQQHPASTQQHPAITKKTHPASSQQHPASTQQHPASTKN